MPTTYSKYPAALGVWTTKRDFDDPIFAVHFNRVQDELSAVETTVGLMPQKATNNPAKRTPDYGTVAARVQQTARAEPMITFRSGRQGVTVVPNEYYRPALDVAEDTHQMATGTGLRLAQTGYWVITLKADWLPVEEVTARPLVRSASIEINGEDLGIRDVLVQSPANRDDMTTMVTWQENLPEGTHIGAVLSCMNANSSPPLAVAHVYLHAYLVRCLNEGGPGLPSPIFEPEPPPPPVFDDGCEDYPYQPPSSGSSGRGVGIDIVTYDSGGHVTSTNHNPYNWPPDRDPNLGYQNR